MNTANPVVEPGPFRRAVVVGGDVLGAIGVVLLFPFVILAFVAPIALGVKFLLWLIAKL